jgi:peptidoglycan/LPS O-acetylase OafA/YrhL
VFHGEKALDTFFVISGFLIGGLLIGEHKKTGAIDIKRFYSRRYLRLTPAYAAALVIVLVAGAEPAMKTPYLWTNIFYVNNFLTCDKMFMDWTWSLAVEEQFYLVLPLFLMTLFFRSKHKVVLLVLVFLASFGVRQYVLALHPHITSTSFAHHYFRNSPEFTCEYFESVYDNLYTRFGPFVLGVLVAYLHTCHGEKLKRLVASRVLVNDGLVCGALAICIALISAPIYDPDGDLSRAFLNAYAVSNRNVWGIAVSVAMVACLYPAGPISRAVARVLSARIWYPVAQLSYCTYLFHLGFVVLSYLIVTRIFQPGIEPKQALSFFGLAELGLTFVLTVLFSFAFGAIIYLLVERPFLNLRR